MPFWQIFWIQNSAAANIVGHRWNANTEALRQITPYSLGWPSISLFSGPNCRQTRDLASKISKEISGGDTPGPPEREGATPSRTYTQHGYTPCAGAQALPLLGPRSRKPFPKSKFTTTRVPVYHCSVAFHMQTKYIVGYCVLNCLQWCSCELTSLEQSSYYHLSSGFQRAV